MEIIFLYNQYLATIWHENYAWIFVCRQYLCQEENISLRAKLQENHELQGLSVYNYFKSQMQAIVFFRCSFVNWGISG